MARINLPSAVHGDRLLNAAQAGILDTLRQVAECEMLTGRTVQQVTVTASGVAVSHGLGRTPIGWHTTDKLDAGDVYRTAWDSKTITLRTASGSVRVTLYVW